MRYLLKKLAYMLGSLFVIVSITFFLMKAIPGDPFSNERGMPQEIYEAMQDHYGLRDPWYVQYGRYLKSILTWDLGPSFKYKGRSVNAIINEGFPVSATLGLVALFISIGVGVTLGTLAALHQNRWQDYLCMLVAVIGVSVPSFILATLLQYVFALKLGWFPVARWGSWEHVVLPAIALAALPTAFIARLTRSSMLEVLHLDFIKTAKSKGLSQWRVVTRHALRNAILPVITYLGQLTVSILVGSFIIEKIFGIPGLGQWFVTSVSNRDYTVIMGTTVFYSIILLTVMFLVDILYVVIDPRIKTQQQRV
ncbi:MAG: ABC transporter permease [Chlamydiales bacterium]|nr:ABC transporter permease [Chlamydiales bacterium]